MTQDIGDHLRKLTSRHGRYWLRDSREGSESLHHDLPFGSVGGEPSRGNRTQQHQSVVVSLPDVAALNALAAGKKTPDQTAVTRPSYVQQPVVVPAPPVHKIPPAPKVATAAKVAKAQPNLTVPAAALAAGKFSELEVKELPANAAQLKKVIPPTPTYPVAAPAKPKKDDAVTAARSSQSQASTDSIAKIADEVLSKYPVASSSLIMFAGSQASLHADETCARVAAELAGRQLGRVLLIDSDFIDRRLTKASGMASQGGLSEIMNLAFPWEKTILKSGSSKLDFMAAGSCPHKRWTPKETLREAVAEMRGQYQFICVSVGDAHSSAGALWSEIADGSFLVVSAAYSSDDIAASAVDRLRENGARMAGCIVADVPASEAA